MERLVLQDDATGYFIVEDSGQRERWEFIWVPAEGGAILKVEGIWELEGDTKVVPGSGQPSPEDRAASALADGTVWSQLDYDSETDRLVASAVGAMRAISTRSFERVR